MSNKAQKFSDRDLPESIKKALEDLKFVEPTKIQQEVLALEESGVDIMTCAETGSGKTGAYGLILFKRLLADPGAKALILAPTRELVHQIADFLRLLVKYEPSIKVTSLVGGSDMKKQINAIKRKPRIIVATPGRLIDHLKRRSLSLKAVKVLVLDEGDRMLDMGFAPQLDQILTYVPEKRQGLLFTATLPKKVQSLAQTYLQDPKLIKVGQASLPVESIRQSVVELINKEKDARVLDEINQRQGSIIIFTRTKRRTDQLTRYLRDYGVAVGLIHGDRSQGQRNRAIKDFKSGKTRVLCATDIAARGIDVPEVEHVINYDLPRMEEDYVHRIGRTARNGADGEALSFVTPSDYKAWMKLVKLYKIKGVELKKTKPSAGEGASSKKKKSGKKRGPRFHDKRKKTSKKKTSGEKRKTFAKKWNKKKTAKKTGTRKKRR